MNEATDDRLVKAALEKTWVLQNRLRFPANVSVALCFLLRFC